MKHRTNYLDPSDYETYLVTPLNLLQESVYRI